MLKVSVIVPVYNPGPNIDECVSSLLGQSLAPEEYELIFVDDGSTDGTSGRLDELASQHANVRVEHIPNSGWPGRPRNIGSDMAQGEFVYFVDNDDWLGPRALERMHANAVRHEADIVIGKVVGHGKTVPRTLFRRNRTDVTLEWPPLLRLPTPHKLFRKSLLDEHGIRFPEGRRRLEDHLFVVHAYFHARRISVLANYPCYHWMLRDASASWKPFDPVAYFDNVREVLDLVDEHTEPGPLRDQLYAHWYRSKLLSRVGSGPFVRREPQYRRELYDEIRRLALERYGPEVNDRLPFNLRMRSSLLREGSYQSIGALAELEDGLEGDVTVRRVRLDDDVLRLELRAALGGSQPLAFVREGARMVWRPPEAVRRELRAEELDASEGLKRSNVQVLLRSTRDGSEYTLPTVSEMVMVSTSKGSEAKMPVLIAVSEASALEAAAGAKLPPGQWHVRVLVDVAGFTAIADAVRLAPRSRFDLLRWRRDPRPLRITVMGDGRLRMRPPLRRRLARRLPRRARRLLRRARRRGRAAIGRTRRRFAAT